jgi:hypothetical protein
MLFAFTPESCSAWTGIASRGGFVWLQAEQGGDATRQTEDWTAVGKEEGVMMFLGSAWI